MSRQLGYDLLRASSARGPIIYHLKPDRAAPVSHLNRIATVACERFMLLMNNTLLLTSNHRLTNIGQVVDYLLGNVEDHGMSGDRGDFYRRKLAQQIYVRFGVHSVTHGNVLRLVTDAIALMDGTRLALACCGLERTAPTPVPVDPQVLDVLARIADMH